MPTPTSAQRRSLKKRQRQGWVGCTHDRGQPFPSLTTALDHEKTAQGHHGRSVVDSDRNASGADKTCNAKNHLQTDGNSHPPLTSEGLRQWEMHAHVDHVYDMVPFWQRGMDAAEKGEVLRLEEFLEKMEDDGGWRTANEVLAMLGEWKATPAEHAHSYGEAGWGQPCREDWEGSRHGPWGPHGLGWGESQRGGWTGAASDATESSHGGDSGWGLREAWVGGTSEFRTGDGDGGGDAAQDGWGARARVRMAGAGRGDGRKEELRHFVDAIARQEAVTEERRRQMHLFFEMPLEQKIAKIEETIRVLRTRGV